MTNKTMTMIFPGLLFAFCSTPAMEVEQPRASVARGKSSRCGRVAALAPEPPCPRFVPRPLTSSSEAWPLAPADCFDRVSRSPRLLCLAPLRSGKVSSSATRPSLTRGAGAAWAAAVRFAHVSLYHVPKLPAALAWGAGAFRQLWPPTFDTTGTVV